MLALVLHPLGPADPAFTQKLATALKLTPYELRPRLMPPGPAVLSTFAELAQAQAQSATLSALRVPHFLVGEEELDREQRRVQARAFTLTPEALETETHDGQTQRLPWAQLRLILQATRIAVTSETREVQTRSFSMSRAVVSGGLMLTKSSSSTQQVNTQQRERVVQLYAPGQPPVALGEQGLLYEGLGAAMQPTRAANYMTLVAELRRRAPNAAQEDRLLQRAGQLAVLGPRLDPEEHLDLAMAVMARAVGA